MKKARAFVRAFFRIKHLTHGYQQQYRRDKAMKKILRLIEQAPNVVKLVPDE